MRCITTRQQHAQSSCHPHGNPLPLLSLSSNQFDMSNPFEEAAFETSIYHYFLFKANQASTIATRQAHAQKNETAPSPLAVLAATATNDKDSGAKKPAAKPTEQDKSKNNASDLSKDGDAGATKPAAAKPAESSDKEKDDAVKKPAAKPTTENTVGTMQASASSSNKEKQPSTGNGLNRLVMNPAIMSEKYNRLVEAMKKDFPQYAGRVPPNAPWVVPDVSLRYTHFPQAQMDASFLRQRVFMLEQQVLQQNNQMQQMRAALQLQDNPASLKRGRPPAGTVPPGSIDTSDLARPAKKIMTDKSFYANKRLSSRPDVPDDVKEMVAKMRKEASNERRSMKKKIARLEKKVSKTSAKLTNAAEEQLLKLPPPPHVLAAAGGAKQAPADAVAKAPPSKPKAPPKPVEPPPCFESRFKELVDYKLANNTTRVPGASIKMSFFHSVEWYSNNAIVSAS